MKRGLAIVAIVAAVAAGVALATEPTSRGQATADAHKVMAALQLPAGASETGSDPSGGLLKQAIHPVTPNLVDLHSFWTVPGDPDNVYQWVRHHPPAGSKLTAHGVGLQNGIWQDGWAAFSFQGDFAGAPSQSLVLDVAAARGGGAAVRADAEVVWLLLRPRWERVPPGVWVVTVAQHGRTARVTDAGRVGRIVALVNRLPAAQPGVRSCPVDVGPTVRLSFFAAPASRPVAVATAGGSGCGLVAFTLRGHSAPPLTDGPHLIGSLRALGLKIA